MTSEKKVEVANLLKTNNLIKMNLQLFAEDSEEIGEEIEDTGMDFDDIEVDDEEEYVEIEEDDPTETEDTEKPEFQTEEQNRAFAQMRRENEQYKKQLEELNNSFANQFKDYGVNDAKSYLDKLQEQQLQARQQELSAKAEEGDIQAIQELTKMQILNDPSIQSIVEQNKLAMQVLEQQQTEQAKAQLISQIDELNSVYGTDIKGIDGLLELPEADEILGYMEKGLKATDAYLLVNRDAVIKGEHNKAKQDVIKKVQGRNHMKTITGNAEKLNNIKMPKDVLNVYREFFPELSEKEIKQAYIKELKDEGVI